MNAGPLSFASLITAANQRLVIPVYQRAYSWDEDNCIQLWEDILAVGRKEKDKHFTGSVVWIQDGTMSATGITPLLLIDGQQRVTTLVLLFVALAAYAKGHPEKNLAFSYEEILGSGYLVNPYKKGDEHYKLILSQGDRSTLCSIIDNLENPDIAVDESASRLISNLTLFKKRLEALQDPNEVWAGVQRLEVVSISLTQGQDNPQLIFESMNSTGKDLTSADLIRNFVLMGLPLDEQENLYSTYWRKIEETLGADRYADVFDDFIRNWLTVLYAPEPLAKRDVYPLFKRHVQNNGYDKNGQIVALLKEIMRYARYYAAITSGDETDVELKRRFDNIASLDTTSVNPMLLSLYADYEADAFSYDDFLTMLDMMESYILRRAICDCPSNVFNKYFASVIARLNKVQEEDGNYREAFTAYLLNEAGSNRRFPTDTEFESCLRARDCYNFRKCFYLLSKIENASHAKNPIDFSHGLYTIEHIIPQNALAHEEWVAMLGDNWQEDFDRSINSIGNLTLSAYNSELSDGSFLDKKARLVGGYDQEYLTLSKELLTADSWDAKAVDARAERLVGIAKSLWKIPSMDDAIRASYITDRKSSKDKRTATFRKLFNAGVFKPGDVLYGANTNYDARITVTESGTLRIQNGEEFNSPSLAFVKSVALLGGKGARNGWTHLCLGENGPILDKFRKDYLAGGSGSYQDDLPGFRSMFWDGFYDHCSTLPDFVSVFGDTSERLSNSDCWASFGVGKGKLHLDAIVFSSESKIGAEIWCRDAETYSRFLDKRLDIEKLFEGAQGELKWDSADAKKKTRAIVVSRSANFDMDDWEEMYETIVTWLWKLKAAVDMTDC